MNVKSVFLDFKRKIIIEYVKSMSIYKLTIYSVEISSSKSLDQIIILHRSTSKIGKESIKLLYLQGGLTIVDVYSEWAGPCSAMSGALKKIKLEV